MKAFLSSLIIVCSLASSQAATTIDATNHFAYGANIGSLNCAADNTNGAVIGEYVCSGSIYAANVGWISLGSGSPANLVQYQNNSAGDFGVNTDSAGNLRGYAYGANIGWVRFENTGVPRVDLLTGNLSGYAYSANCGWISLSNSVAFVQTTHILRGTDSDTNGLPDAWEISNFGSLGINRNADADGDGLSNVQEYLAGTNPNDAADSLKITSFHRGNLGDPTRLDLVWTSKPTRAYALQHRPDLESSPWNDLVVFSFLGANNAGLNDTNNKGFYEIRAFRPLTP